MPMHDQAIADGHGLLSDAATRIGSTLDLFTTARELVDVAVPRFADGASVYILERLMAADELAERAAGGPVIVRRLAISLTHHDMQAGDVAVPADEVIAFSDGTPHARCVTRLCPVVFDQVDGETSERIRQRAGGDEILSSYSEFLAVPLMARGSVVGLAVFARTPRRPRFGPRDMALAAELASRAAICIDNARLFTRERRIAIALQRSMLPSTPITPDGVEVAHRYQPAGASIVGGDWYDILPLSGGRAAVIIGDAMGHGAEAAAVMVQLRAAAHALTGLELAPEEILCRLDKMATDLEDAPLATCLYAILDPATRSCTIACAGHLPPVLALSDGTTHLLDLPSGLPLGLAATAFQATRRELPPGAVLALYTDGLVESRTRSFDAGIEELRDALSRPRDSLYAACQEIVAALCQQRDDDVTLVLARIALSTRATHTRGRRTDRIARAPGR